MLTVALLVFGLVGLVGLVGGIYGALYSFRQIRAAQLRWWRIQWLPLTIGVVSAALFSLLPYPTGEASQVVGIPFPAAVFERHHGIWMDFVGVTTIPFFIANVVFFLLLPQVVVAWRLRARQNAA